MYIFRNTHIKVLLVHPVTSAFLFAIIVHDCITYILICLYTHIYIYAYFICIFLSLREDSGFGSWNDGIAAGCHVFRKQTSDPANRKGGSEASCLHLHGGLGFLSAVTSGRFHRGTPIAGWFISWKIPPKWMMTGG